MPDIARDPAFLKRRRMRRIGSALAVALALITVAIAVARMEPASPTADAATVLRDTVKRGSFVHTVRGLGRLVPEDTRWISATTDGRVDHILHWPRSERSHPSSVFL